MWEAWNQLLVISAVLSLLPSGTNAAFGWGSNKPQHKYNDVECQLECNNRHGMIELPNSQGLIPITKAHVWDDGKNSHCDCLMNDLTARAAATQRARARSKAKPQVSVRVLLEEMGLDYEEFDKAYRKSTRAGKNWLKKNNIKFVPQKVDLKKMRAEVEKELAEQRAKEEVAPKTKGNQPTGPVADCKAKCNKEYGFLYDPPRPPITNNHVYDDPKTREVKCGCEMSLQLISILETKKLSTQEFEKELRKGPGPGRYWLSTKGFKLTPVEVAAEPGPPKTAPKRQLVPVKPSTGGASSSGLSQKEKAETLTMPELKKQRTSVPEIQSA